MFVNCLLAGLLLNEILLENFKLLIKLVMLFVVFSYRDFLTFKEELT